MKRLVVLLAIVTSADAFALPVRNPGPSSPSPYGSIEYSCGEPNCQEAINREVKQLCVKAGYSLGEVLDARMNGVPTTECFHPRGSFPFCMTFENYSVIYQCQ